MLNGLQIHQNNGYIYCAIENFTPEIEGLIRAQLATVWAGFSDVQKTPEIHSYNRTLGLFLDRYNSKSENTKKGMIGELLAHILVGQVLTDLVSLSVLKNKEERNVKKGFDIIYYEERIDGIWYSEVKSGRSKSKTSTDYNTVLLERSHTDLSIKVDDNRQTLWDSALIDVSLAIGNGRREIKLKRLLDDQSPVHKKKDKKNGIIISVLYHNTADKVELKSIKDFKDKVHSDSKYLDHIIFSIQKATFEKVADFLRSEYTKP